MTSNQILILGLALILIGFFLVFFSSIRGGSDVKSAGGIFLGPVPLFGFGEKKIFYFLWALAVVLFLYFVFIRR